jgi:DNA-binding CsgD family transcriptional regulator
MSTEIMTVGEQADPIAMLTPREKSELILCAQGYTMKEVANTLNISVKTAETHRNNIGRKLGHPNRSQLTAFALSHHLIDPLAASVFGWEPLKFILIRVRQIQGALLDRSALQE